MKDGNDKIPKTFKDWREARRFRAWELKQEGWTQTRIAEALGVTPGAVSQWFKAVREQGLAALYSRKGGGPKPRLSEDQLERLPELLAQGPEAYGFRGEVWTRRRVGSVIQQEFGIAYSDTHVGRLLDKIGWSRQKPVERAGQRDEEAIAEWREETFPELEKKPPQKAAPWSL
jgi:transposase